MSKALDSGFQAVLGQVLRSAPKLRGGRDRHRRSHRRRLAEGGTFSGHRAYSHGEDLRNLDWNVLARTDELFLKILEDEDRRGLTLVLDCSASMTAGNRWQGALRLAAILGGLALVHLDGLRLVLGKGNSMSFQGMESLSQYLQRLENIPIQPEQPAVLGQQILEQGYADNVCWLSDFTEPQVMLAPLHLLRRHGCRVQGWLPSQPTDEIPDLSGYLVLRDPESSQEVTLQVDADLRRAMVKELRNLRRMQDRIFAEAGSALVRFPLPVEGDYRLSSWLGGGCLYRL